MHGTIKVRKIGNSLGLIIPQFVAQEMRIEVGCSLKMTYRENTIILTTGPTDNERLDAYITKLLLENERIAQGFIPR